MKSDVILLPCSSYDTEQVYESIKTGIQLLGGLDSLIDKQEKILLKPNLLKKAEPDRAVVTHPSVAGAFARLLSEEGCPNVFLSDSCGIGSTTAVVRASGMEDILKKYQTKILDFSSSVKVKYPEGVQAQEFVIPKELSEMDCIISLAKMKTHALERITGAVKNSYGFIYGNYKRIGHTQYPSADSFARMLVDLNKYTSPRLYVLDGVLAMEGNGPGSGDPISMNVILMSKDPVALDSVFCRLIHLDPALVPTNYHGEKMGLGTYKEENIRLLLPEGECSIEEVVRRFGNPDFHVDRRRSMETIWTKMAKALNIFQKKPYIKESDCIHCGVCVESCPVPEKAVQFKNGKGNPPVYDYKKCIRCFCCQEMCPAKAIRVK